MSQHQRFWFGTSYLTCWLIHHLEIATVMITSSAFGFVPLGMFATYCVTKSYIHSLMVGLRQQFKHTNVNVIEIGPPYVATDLVSKGHRAAVPVKPMALEDFTNAN